MARMRRRAVVAAGGAGLAAFFVSRTGVLRMTGEAPPHGQAWLDAETRIGEAPHEHGDDLRLWLRLLTCSTLVENEVRRRLRDEFQTTLPRFDLMAQLERAPDGMVIGDLSKRMMVSPGNMTDLVDRMVESGHLVRSSPPNDRRVQIIALTPEGHSFFRRMADRHSAWIGEFFAGLPGESVAALTRDLGVLKESVRTALATVRG